MRLSVSRRSLLLGGSATALLAFLHFRTPAPPQERTFKPPVLLDSAVFDSYGQLYPSPSGDLVAVNVHLLNGVSWKAKSFVVLFSCTQHKEIARIPVSQDSEDKFVWDAHNHLWILRGNGWDVWQSPTAPLKRVDAHIPAKIWHEESSNSTFDPNTQTVVFLHFPPADKNSLNKALFIEVWRHGQRLHALNFPSTESGGEPTYCAWSPDRKQLAFALTGWVGFEREGPHELWFLDVQKGKLRRLAQGDVETWTFADPFAQRAEPRWSADGTTLVWGDQRFGINETTLATGQTHSLFVSAYSGNSPTPSPSQRSVAFMQGSDLEGGGSLTLVVEAHDGSWWARGPQLSEESWAWNPTRDELLYLAPSRDGTTGLWSWDVAS